MPVYRPPEYFLVAGEAIFVALGPVNVIYARAPAATAFPAHPAAGMGGSAGQAAAGTGVPGVSQVSSLT